MASSDDEAVLKALTTKGAFSPCQRCKRTDFGLIGYTPISLKTSPNEFDLGGTGVSAAMIMCRQCGCLNLHATAALGVGEGG